MISYLGALLAGLATLATPCILPMVPVYLGMLLGSGAAAQSSDRSRNRLLWMTAFFSLGFSLVFVSLGFAVGSLGQLLTRHRDALSLGGAALVLIFALLMLGWIRLPGSQRDLRFQPPRAISHPLGGLLFGAVFGLGWTPCAGPMLGSILSLAAIEGDRFSAASLLLTYSAGIALPLLGLAAFADRAIPLLRRLNQHLERLQKISGLALIVVALSLAWAPLHDQLAQLGPQQIVTTEGQLVASLVDVDQASPRLVELVEKDCPVCARMQAKIDTLTEDCRDHSVEVIRIDLSEKNNRHLRSALQITAVPTILMINDRGQVLHRLVGERSLQEIRGLAASLQNNRCAEVDPIDPASLTQGAACNDEANLQAGACI